MPRRGNTTLRNSAGPRVALVAALAVLAVPTAAGGAQAPQDPAGTAQELRRIEEDLASGRSTKAQLERLARDLGREIERLRTEMAETADRQQKAEETVAEVEASLAELRQDAHEKRAVLAGREFELGQLVGALQRLARRPPAALLVMGRPPLETVRTGILLESSIPQLNAEAERLKAELASLAETEGRIRAQRARLDTATAGLDRDRARLAALAAEKAELLAATQSRAAGTAERVRALGESARSLRELLAGLEAQRARERAEQQRLTALVRPVEPVPPPVESMTAAAPPAAGAVPLPIARPAPPGDRGRTEPAPASVLALLPSAPPISTAKGRLLRPAVGPVVRGYGQRDPDGLRNRGVTIAARDGAAVVAPYDGTVIYAGPFEGFGLILIIEHGEGYHTLLAGLGRIGLQVGQRVLAGEPVGAMRSRPAGGGGGPELYVELRHNGDPIDPVPWLSGLTGKAKG